MGFEEKFLKLLLKILYCFSNFYKLKENPKKNISLGILGKLFQQKSFSFFRKDLKTNLMP